MVTRKAPRSTLVLLVLKEGVTERKGTFGLKARQDEYQLAFRVFCVPGYLAFCLELR